MAQVWPPVVVQPEPGVASSVIVKAVATVVAPRVIVALDGVNIEALTLVSASDGVSE